MRLVIFTDGACSGNPGPGGWGSIVSLSSGETVELGGSHPETTNNRMEMTALLESFLFLLKAGWVAKETVVYADSKYMIDGLTKWIHGWVKNGWINGGGEAVKNQDLWIELKRTKDSLEAKGFRFSFQYVPGHSGVPGNERCDEIAQGFSSGLLPVLYRGASSDYSVSLEVAPPQVTKKYTKPVYLSFVGGEVFRDESWSACQARTQGRSAAKYKKVASEAEELETLKKWGVRPKP